MRKYLIRRVFVVLLSVSLATPSYAGRAEITSAWKRGDMTALESEVRALAATGEAWAIGALGNASV